MQEKMQEKLNGKIIGWVAIAIAVIGFFIWHIPLGIIAMLLSLVGLMSDEKGISWTALAIGAITVIVGII